MKLRLAFDRCRPNRDSIHVSWVTGNFFIWETNPSPHVQPRWAHVQPLWTFDRLSACISHPHHHHIEAFVISSTRSNSRAPRFHTCLSLENMVHWLSAHFFSSWIGHGVIWFFFFFLTRQLHGIGL
jgi:hypothetical protein